MRSDTEFESLREDRKRRRREKEGKLNGNSFDKCTDNADLVRGQSVAGVQRGQHKRHGKVFTLLLLLLILQGIHPGDNCFLE